MSELKHLGPPDLKIAGFQLWVHGREYPQSQSYYDGNWLRVTAHCGELGASIWVQGTFLMVPDIVSLGNQCAAMWKGDVTSARLEPLEPSLKISLDAVDRLGHICARVELTPDHLAQFHQFDFQIDQSYLPELAEQCAAIVTRYPLRGLQT